MSDFDTALGYVHGVLNDLHSRGSTLVAPIHLLQALAALPALPAPHPTPAPNLSPPAREQPRPTAPPRPTVPILPKLPPVAATSAGSKAERLAAFREKALSCEQCAHLVASRTQVVFGVGNPEAELMFVGEAPGEDEDVQGEPFVGKAGQLLTKIIEAMGYPRGDVYIANVLKCRPDMPAGASGNRKPTLDEMKTCLPYLQEQIDIIRPRALIALGATALEGLLGATDPVGKMRGKWLEFAGIPLMVTYHPAYLLRNQSMAEKRKVWEDMLKVLEKLDRPISEKQRNFFTRA